MFNSEYSAVFSLPVFGCRSFVIQQIPSSNLFMVVVENKCDCSSAPPVTTDPIEIMYILFRYKEKQMYEKNFDFSLDVIFEKQFEG